MAGSSKIAKESDAGEKADEAAAAACQNCGAPLSGPFCARCGQHDRTLRRPFWSLTVEFADDLISFDSRAFRSLWPLLLKPGKISRDFVDGRRATFVPPIRLLLITVLLFFLAIEIGDVALIRFVKVPVPQGVNATIEFGGEEQDTTLALDFFVPMRGETSLPVLTRGELEEIEREFAQQRAENQDAEAVLDFAARLLRGLSLASENPAIINDVFNTWLPRAMLILVPVFALLLRAVHWGRDRYYFDQIIFSLHFHAFLFLLLTVLVILGTFGLGGIGGWIYFIGVPAYLLAAMKRFHGQGWIRTVFKFLLVSALYNLVLIVALTAILLKGLAEAR